MAEIGGEWQVAVFPSREAAEKFAQEQNLRLEEMKNEDIGT